MFIGMDFDTFLGYFDWIVQLGGASRAWLLSEYDCAQCRGAVPEYSTQG